ncbi:unnamed protein product [Scytosiphon promiscuus]
MAMMGPSDLSELEDEVKVIQQNVRAWVLKCNYKSLRKAAKTLQVAWRERQKNRTGEAGAPNLASPTSLPRMSSLSRMGGSSISSTSIGGGGGGEGIGLSAAAAAADGNVGGGGGGVGVDVGGSGAGVVGESGGPEPMDEANEAENSGRETSGVESGSDAGAAERATREERAAKALQTAARVMLARKGRLRYQRLAKETSALLLIQKRSREWLKNKGGEQDGGGAAGGEGEALPMPQQQPQQGL